MKTRNLAVAFAFAGSLLVACGDGGSLSAPPLVPGVAGNTTIATTAANGATVIGAVSGSTFNFSAGVPAFGTTAPTTLAVTNAGAGFTASSGTNTATGVLTYGSCIFEVTASNFPAGSPLALGQRVTVNPCSLNVGTAGAVAGGTPVPRNVALVLGAASSANSSVTVGVNSSGGLTLNGNLVTTVTLTPVTGSGT